MHLGNTLINKSIFLHRPFYANATDDENKPQREGGYGHIDAVKCNLSKGSQSNPFLDLLPVKQVLPHFCVCQMASHFESDTALVQTGFLLHCLPV